MDFFAAPMTPAHAAAIATWRYAGPYALYDSDGETESLMRDPANGYLAVLDSAGRLAGFCCFGPEAQVPGWRYDAAALDLGAGLRPDLTGSGHGGRFIRAIAGHGHHVLGAMRLRATVATWNERSIRACAAAGFRTVGQFRRGGMPDGMAFTVLERGPLP